MTTRTLPQQHPNTDEATALAGSFGSVQQARSALETLVSAVYLMGEERTILEHVRAHEARLAEALRVLLLELDVYNDL